MKNLYSLRMRSSKKGKHISGAEKIIGEKEINSNLKELVTRAREHSQGQAQKINITIEDLAESKVNYLSSLAIKTIEVENYQQGRKEAKELLTKIGIESQIIEQAVNLLISGPSPSGGNMRGAVLLDIETAQRLEEDHYRGLRATKMDYQATTKESLIKLLQEYNLNQSHLPEALALATKVVNHQAIIAELCLSDDTNYQAGYVASKEFGYCRFPYLKPQGQGLGGRVFFIKATADLKALKRYLEEDVVLIDQLPTEIKFCSSSQELI